MAVQQRDVTGRALRAPTDADRLVLVDGPAESEPDGQTPGARTTANIRATASAGRPAGATGADEIILDLQSNARTAGELLELAAALTAAVLTTARPWPVDGAVTAQAVGAPFPRRSALGGSLGSPSMKRLLLLLAFVGLATVAVRQLKSS